MSNRIFRSSFFEISEEEKKELADKRLELEKQIKQFKLSSRPELVSIGATDPRIIEMREIKKKHVLRSIDLVEELKCQDFHITKTALSAYLQGNVRGTDSRNWSATGKVIKKNHIDDLLEQFRMIDKRLVKATANFHNRTMRQIIDAWGVQLQVRDVSVIRALTDLSGLNFSTLYKWYQQDRKPRTLKYLVAIQELVDLKVKNKKIDTEFTGLSAANLAKVKLTPTV